MSMARPAAEIEPNSRIFSRSRILPGPIRSSSSRSMRTLSDGRVVFCIEDSCGCRIRHCHRCEGLTRQGGVPAPKRCDVVIATEAKQSSFFPGQKSGVLRRGACHPAALRADPLAPRNDGALSVHLFLLQPGFPDHLRPLAVVVPEFFGEIRAGAAEH